MKRGLEHFVYRELRVFAAQGLSISIFPTKYGRGLYDAEGDWFVHRWRPLVVLVEQPFFLLRAPRTYLRLLREALVYRALVDFVLAWHFARAMAEVDVIYSTFGDHKLFVGYFLKKIVRRPLVVTIHAYELYQNPNPRFFRRALAACDQIITVTEFNRELLAERYQIAPAKIDVIRISVDVDRYRPAEKFVILIVAFFAERKGHEVLFEAVRRLDRDDIEVWVVGDEGAEAAVDVRGLATRLGIDSQVAFFGKLGGVALEAVYRACDVFCLPCREDSSGVAEGFPTALAEAMAFGKPVITTRHVEIPRIIDEVVVDENDVEGLVQAIDRLYQSPPLRARLGEKNRRVAEALFSNANAEQTATLLSTLTEKQAQRAPTGEPATGRRVTLVQHRVGGSQITERNIATED